ncbi:MAG: DsbA family protein [Paracoccaceae bacterium]|tara:strand:+ start:997 stop:1713 length:717 start_codon:yes stop_codon:yes gene_type:complete
MKYVILFLGFFLNNFIASLTFAQDTDLEKKVLEIIRNNPEIIMEAIKILQAKDAKNKQEQADQNIKSNKQRLEDDKNAPILGNPNGEIIIVEFFDYNCGYCRRAFKTIMNLIADNNAVKVVMRELPILGDASVFTAKASLASQKQQKYEEFHVALMNNRSRNTEKSVLKIAKKIGMDIDQLQLDMNSSFVLDHIEESQKLSESLGISGTPAFVFGEKIVPGAIDLQAMKDLVAQIASN